MPWGRPSILNGVANDMGQFIVPPKGARVVVSFEYNDKSKPLYFGSIPSHYGDGKKINDNTNIFYGQGLNVTTEDRITDLDSSSAQSVLFKSLKGSTIIIDDKDGKESIKIIDASGQEIIMENTSDYSLGRRGNRVDVNPNCSITLKTVGDINLICNKLNIQANKTNIKDYV